MNFETKDSFSPEKQLTSLNRADLERKREIVIQKRKDLEKKLLTTIDDLLAQKLGEGTKTRNIKKKTLFLNFYRKFFFLFWEEEGTINI